MQGEILQIDMVNSEKNLEGNVREQESNQGLFSSLHLKLNVLSQK
jgi:hypothetical protein